MTTAYSITVNDWRDEKWRFIGRELAERIKGEWSNQNADGISEDDYYPMMNYAYPLYDCPSEESIMKIQDKTSLTVVGDTETGDFFLALCGGGMDLSQDIAMAYILAGERVPYELALEVSRQPNLSQHGKDFRKVMEECKRSMSDASEGAKGVIISIDKAIKESLEIDKKRKLK